MTTHVLISGTVFRPPKQQTAKSGKVFTSATIRVKDGDATQWCKAIVFSESAQVESMRLADGDALSVQGALKAELYRPEGGETRLSLSVLVDAVLALRQPRATKSKQARSATKPEN